MNVKDDDFKILLIKQLAELSAKIDALIQVIAITSRKEIIAKEKTKTDQIVMLSDLGLSRKIIALIIGSTPESVSSRLSQLKAEKEKTKQSKEVEESHE